MNTENTIKAIKKMVIPFYHRLKALKPSLELEYKFDNAPGHRSKKTQSFVKSKQCVPFVKLGGWPINAPGGRAPNSPDLCCIEYVFNEWSEKVYSRQPCTVVELKNVAQEEWQKIPQSFIQSCYKHMLKVYPWVVEHGGNQYKQY